MARRIARFQNATWCSFASAEGRLVDEEYHNLRSIGLPALLHELTVTRGFALVLEYEPTYYELRCYANQVPLINAHRNVSLAVRSVSLSNICRFASALALVVQEPTSSVAVSATVVWWTVPE